MVVPDATIGPARPVVGLVDSGPRRQCGRCRMVFALDEHGDVPRLADWWLCDPCRARLIPDWRH